MSLIYTELSGANVISMEYEWALTFNGKNKISWNQQQICKEDFENLKSLLVNWT